MREGEAIEQSYTANVGVSIRGAFAQPLHQIRPDDVGVCFRKDVPSHVGPLLPGSLYHIEELVLVEIPAARHVGCAVRLGDGAALLGIVKFELLVGLLDGFVDAVQDVVDMVLADLLFLRTC